LNGTHDDLVDDRHIAWDQHRIELRVLRRR
jgi:hypothetical protein